MKFPYILSRYSCRIFLKWFSIVFLGGLILLLLFDFAELARRTASKDSVSVINILQIALWRLVFLSRQILPFTILFAALLSFWSLKKKSEFDVMRAAGLSTWQLIMPYCALSLLIGVFDTTVYDHLSSSFLQKSRTLENKYIHGENRDLSFLSTGVWMRFPTLSGNAIVRIGKIDIKSEKIFKISILDYDDQNGLLKRLDAREGQLKEEGLLLKDVWTSKPEQVPFFKREELFKAPLTLAYLKDSQIPPELVSFWDLPQTISKMDGAGFSTTAYTLKLYGNLTQGIWLMTMVLIAAACAWRSLRQGGGTRLIGMSIGLSLVLFLIKDVTQAMGQSGALTPLIAAALPTVTSALIGLTIILRFDSR